MTGARDLLRRLLWWRRSPMPPYQPGPDERMATVTPHGTSDYGPGNLSRGDRTTHLRPRLGGSLT